MSIWAIPLLTALLTVPLLATGCGGGGDSTTSADEITVETGSLSKAAFIKRADAVCEANRKQFDLKYTIFIKTKLRNGDKEHVLQAELVDTVVVPSYGKDVEEIIALGAPSGDEKEVTSFLKTLQKRLEELHENPSELSNEMFAKPAELATKYGLDGCVKSLIG